MLIHKLFSICSVSFTKETKQLEGTHVEDGKTANSHLHKLLSMTSIKKKLKNWYHFCSYKLAKDFIN